MQFWDYDRTLVNFVLKNINISSASGLVPVNSKHGADIEIKEFTRLNIDYKQMGLGGNTSWGRPVHDEYTIVPESYNYSFIIDPGLNK